jgi:pyruvate, water dikinase
VASDTTGWVRWLDDLSQHDVDVVGGKIAQLAGLKAAGVRVPDGFAITADAYREAMRSSGLSADLQRLSAVATDVPDQADAAARECAGLISSCSVPLHVSEAISSAYSQLMLLRRDPLPRVAVRSSALREDSSDASSAGQYDSFLGIAGATSVVEAVRQCWASLFNERAVVYRAKHGIDVNTSPMAVGVIELVDARAAGVGFSLHPVTGSLDRLVVESTFGWGEALVQGRVNPDHFEVDRHDLRVLRRQVGKKSWVSTWSSNGDGITETAMPDVLVSESSLSDDELRSICRVLLEVEERLGHPVDIEWAWPRSGDAPLVVQARAETVHGTRVKPGDIGEFDPMANALRHAFDRGGA